jgi:uncharacterized protein (DUF1015 family)
MHDSLTPEEIAAIKASNPDSFLHVTRRAGDPGESDDPAEAAAQGTEALGRLLAQGAFRELPGPSLFVYRLDVEGASHTGIVAEVPVAEFERGQVRGHEDVQPDRVEALAQYLEGVGVSSDPVALVFAPDPDVARALAEVAAGEPLLLDVEPSMTQTVWRVDDDAARATITARLGSAITYVADGHHRVAASIAASKRVVHPARAAILCVLYPADELRILAFHRLVTGIVDVEAFRRGLDEGFTVEETPEPLPGPGSFAIRVGGRWLLAMPRDLERRPGVTGLDVTRLHRELLQPLLGVADVGDPRLEVIPDVVPVAELAARADMEGGALFLLHPPSVEELVEVADRGEVVVPKSTYFYPKPKSGVLLRLGDG